MGDTNATIKSFTASLGAAYNSILDDALWCTEDDFPGTSSCIQRVTSEAIDRASLALSSLKSLEEERRLGNESARQVIDEYEGLDSGSRRKLLNNEDHMTRSFKLGLDRWAEARQASFEASEAASAHALSLLSKEVRTCAHLSDHENVPTYAERDSRSHKFCSEVNADFKDMWDELVKLSHEVRQEEDHVPTGYKYQARQVVV
ncbi:hypothetical protein JCM24511_04890 [Saitozyma sp. JCM 24511]|nr:hypothetical protein JCM24511_04890 [Saitozyma sp. JCM 24511]